MLFVPTPLVLLALAVLNTDVATSLPADSFGVLQRRVPADTIDKYTTEVGQSLSKVFGVHTS